MRSMRLLTCSLRWIRLLACTSSRESATPLSVFGKFEELARARKLTKAAPCLARSCHAQIAGELESVGSGKLSVDAFGDSALEESKLMGSAELQLEWIQQKIGFNDAEIQRVASIISGGNRVWKNALLLSELKSRGMSKEQLIKTLRRCPSLLETSAEKLDAYFSLLEEYGIADKEALQVLGGAPQNVKLSIPNNWRPKLDALHDMGLSKWEIRLIIRSFPPLIGCRFHDNIRKKLVWFKNEVGIDLATCVHKFFVRAPMAFACSSSSFTESVKMLKGWGVSLSDISHVIMTYPTVLSMRPETLKAKFSFAIEFLQKTPDIIVRSPRYFGSSLENVIMFRVALLDMHGIDYTQVRLNMLVTLSSPQFHRKFGLEEDLKVKKWWKTLDFAQKIEAINCKTYPGKL